MTAYDYPNIATEPNMEQIHADCISSGLPEPLGCRWDEDGELLKVLFTDPLTAPQKTTLDTIVANNT